MTTTDTATDKLELARIHAQEAAQDAKTRAGEVGTHAQDAAHEVSVTAADQAQQVKAETVRQARNLASDATDQLSGQAAQQTQRISANLRDLGDELLTMAQAGSGGTAAEVAHQAAERAHQAAGYLDGRQPAEILDDLRSLARRRPGAFLAGAAVLGLVAGRVGRGVKDADPAPEAATSTGTGNPYPSEPPLVAPPSERTEVLRGERRPVDFSGPAYQNDLVDPEVQR